jgi:hypothetical protein
MSALMVIRKLLHAVYRMYSVMSCIRWVKNRNKHVGINDTDKVGYDERILIKLLF